MNPALLIRASILYLAAPQFLFLLSWLSPWVGWPVAVALACGLVVAWRASEPEASEPTAASGRGVLIAAGVIAFVLCFVGGASGVFHQTWDWEKHNAVLLDLTRHPWPVVYELPGPERYHLLYYLSYYLPAAWAASVWGSAVGQWVLFAWTVLGTFLALLWFAHLVRRWPIASMVALPLLSGMDVVGYWLLHGGFPSWFQNVEGWLRGHTYSAHLVLHVWDPQHAITAWIGTPMVLYGSEHPRRLGVAALGCALLFFWSSFIFLGVVIVLVWAACRPSRWRASFDTLRQPAALALYASAGILLACEWVFLSNGMSHVPFAWLWQDVSLRVFAPRLLLFYAVEFGCYLLFIPRPRNLDARDRSYLLFGTALLLIGPWVHFGQYNDLSVRVAHVAGYVFWVPILAALWACLEQRAVLRTVPLLACLAVGCITPFLQLRFIARATAMNPHPVRPQIAVPDLQPIAIAAQYLGRLDTWKARILATDRTTEAVVPPLPGNSPFAFRAPLLLSNFRGQGILRDASGWWMWNRGGLEYTFRVEDASLRHGGRPLRITFEATAGDRERTVTLELRGVTAASGRTFAVRPGAWTEVQVDDVRIEDPEITLAFASPEPITGAADDPHRREFAVRNVRFEVR